MTEGTTFNAPEQGAGTGMGFVSAVKSGLTKYATFNGRAMRSEFWFFYLFTVLVYVAAAILDAAVINPGGGGTVSLTIIVILALFLPNLAISTRRLHDTNRSGWWILVSFVPLVGAIILLVWYCTRGTQGANRFG